MSGSTMAGGRWTKSITARARVSECATVKAVTVLTTLVSRRTPSSRGAEEHEVVVAARMWRSPEREDWLAHRRVALDDRQVHARCRGRRACVRPAKRHSALAPSAAHDGHARASLGHPIARSAWRQSRRSNASTTVAPASPSVLAPFDAARHAHAVEPDLDGVERERIEGVKPRAEMSGPASPAARDSVATTRSGRHTHVECAQAGVVRSALPGNRAREPPSRGRRLSKWEARSWTNDH